MHDNLSSAGRGLAQTFGLDARAAALTVIVDGMATSASIASMGLLVPVELFCGVTLSVIVYKMQRTWYGDDHNSALIKGMVIGLLTAIPVATTPIVIAYAGIGGLMGLTKKRRPGSGDVIDMKN